MIDERQLCALLAPLEVTTLRHWIEVGWVRPASPAPAFDEADVARVRLLCDLRYEIAIADEALPVVVSLLDQVYDLRRQLGSLLSAVAEQPAEVRRRLQAAIAERRQTPDDAA
jgi:chaperone modulatory protein CbpM